MIDFVRLFLATLFFFVSLLAVFKAPTNKTWRLAVGVTELPIVFIFLTISVFCLRFTANRFLLAGDLICFAALLLFLSPVFRAIAVARKLPVECERIFGTKKTHSPFSLLDLAKILPPKAEKAQSYIYKNINSKNLVLDFYPSGSKEKSPCVIIVHGGGWDSGDSKQLPALNHVLSSQNYSVAAINYSLAPQNNFPAPVEDVKDAIAFLKSKSTELNIDSEKLILLGRSAGGQIALHAAYTFNDSSIKGVIAFYAPADMVWAWSVPGNPLIMDSRAVLRNYIGDTFENAEEKFFEASPLEFVSISSPPSLIIHGVRDEMVAYEHSRRLNEKLNENGVTNLLLTLPWATHACDFSLNGPSGQLSTYAIEKFLAFALK